MELIDTHCHLTSDQLSRQGAEIFSRASAAQITCMITVASGPEDIRAARRLAGEQQNVFFAAGLHPHEAADLSESVLAEVRQASSDPKALAVGETGLDYHYQRAQRQQQRAAFEEQVDLAERLGKPLVVHCRDAYEDCLAILNASRGRLDRVVFHCFTGTRKHADAILDHGYLLSFTGIVTFANAAELHAVVRAVPADGFMLETDAPYLSPVPVRKIRVNEPSHLLHTAKFVATLRGISLTKLALETTANAVRSFGGALDPEQLGTSGDTGP